LVNYLHAFFLKGPVKDSFSFSFSVEGLVSFSVEGLVSFSVEGLAGLPGTPLARHPPSPPVLPGLPGQSHL
jgi:hypothetical protein